MKNVFEKLADLMEEEGYPERAETLRTEHKLCVPPELAGKVKELMDSHTRGSSPAVVIDNDGASGSGGSLSMVFTIG